MSSKRKSPPNKFEDAQAPLNSYPKKLESLSPKIGTTEPYQVMDTESLMPHQQSPQLLQLQLTPTLSLHPKEELLDSSGFGQKGQKANELSGDEELSDLGSLCSGNSFDGEDAEEGKDGGGQDRMSRRNGKIGGSRRSNLSCRDLTAGGDAGKSPTFSGGSQLDVKNNNKKSMDDVLRKLSSKFGSNFEGSSGLNSSASAAIGNTWVTSSHQKEN